MSIDYTKRKGKEKKRRNHKKRENFQKNWGQTDGPPPVMVAHAEGHSAAKSIISREPPCP